MKDDFTFDESAHLYTVNGFKVPSVTQILAPLTVGKYPANTGVVQQAASRGSRVHELCQLYDLDSLPSEFEGELIPYVQAWVDFCRDYRPEWLFVEKPMHYGVDFAGTMDRLGLIDGRHVVVDIKSAQSLDRPAKVALACQLGAYQRMAKKNGLCQTERPEDAFGVQLLKTGRYRLYRRDDLERVYNFNSQNVFSALVSLYGITHGRAAEKEGVAHE